MKIQFFPPLRAILLLTSGTCSKANEPLGARIASLHNLAFYGRLMQDIRGAIMQGSWNDLGFKIRPHKWTNFVTMGSMKSFALLFGLLGFAASSMASFDMMMIHDSTGNRVHRYDPINGSYFGSVELPLVPNAMVASFAQKRLFVVGGSGVSGVTTIRPVKLKTVNLSAVSVLRLLETNFGSQPVQTPFAASGQTTR